MNQEFRKSSPNNVRSRPSLRKPWRNWLLPASIAVSPWLRAES
ncbi:MAG: hypothetical protein SFU83_13050 [Meiothermus sp.]|nr:hypothetical protein [Meiothermus sp.]